VVIVSAFWDQPTRNAIGTQLQVTSALSQSVLQPGSHNVERAKKVKLLLGLEYSIKGKDKRHYLRFLLRKMHGTSNICSFSEKKPICKKDIRSFEYLLIVGEETHM
jgi:hypothetical protein